MNTPDKTEPTLVCPKCKGKGGWETGPHSESCHLCDGTGRIKPTPDVCQKCKGTRRYYCSAGGGECPFCRSAILLAENEKANGDFWVQVATNAEDEADALRSELAAAKAELAAKAKHYHPDAVEAVVTIKAEVVASMGRKLEAAERLLIAEQNERNRLHSIVVAFHRNRCTVNNCALDGGPEHDEVFRSSK